MEFTPDPSLFVNESPPISTGYRGRVHRTSTRSRFNSARAIVIAERFPLYHPETSSPRASAARSMAARWVEWS
jgi:hypothetical protein